MAELFDFPLKKESLEAPRLQPSDWLEREKALDITRSWIVEAPAGSGKTGLLIQRYLKLLALPTIEQPEQILAITFTLKATGEIRERIIEELGRAAGPDQTKDEFERRTREFAQAVLEHDRLMDWDLLNHPRRLNVRTIDSVCAEIARGLPVLAGGSGLSPVEDATALYRMAVERTLMQLGDEDQALSDALRLLLLHRDGNLIQLRDLLAEMLSLRDQWGRLVPLGHELLEEGYLDHAVLPQIERALANVICAELAKLARIMPTDLLSELCALSGELGSNDGYQGQPSPIAVCAGVYSVPEKTVEDLERWQALCHLLAKKDWRRGFNRNHLEFNIERQQKARLSQIVDQLRGRDDLLVAIKRVASLPPARYPEEQWLVAKALFRVLYRALAELQVVFAERGECDFTELGLLARTALHRDSGTMETALGTRLQHILVDEMQDTSTSQYELIQLLTQGWDGHSQTIFLVGDPKQSIYLFRQARVERFIRTMHEKRLGELELGCIHLTANFRSQSRLIHAFNEDFEQLFPREVDEDHLEEAPYVAADPVRGPAPNSTTSVVWHAQVLPPGLSPEDKRYGYRRTAKVEAAHIRKIIEEWRSRPLPEGRTKPWEIAVLVRNRNHLTDIVAEFKRIDGAGSIPFRAVNIESLDEQPEILDLYALTRALLHPADRTAWLAVLRAPWCGLELADLHSLTGADDATLSELTLEELVAERSHALSESGGTRLQRLTSVLVAALKQHSRLPIAEWIERTWRSIGGASYLTEEERTNARRYFELLDMLQQETGTIDLAQLKYRLSRLYSEPALSSGAVDLTTIHGAKGLEWDVVLVPALEKNSRTSRGRLLTWHETSSTDEHAARVLLAPIVGKGRQSELLNTWLNQIQTSREEAESRRLFYVACTRAREELHLFAAPAGKSDGSISLSSGSLLQAAWRAAERHFVNTQVAAKPLTAPVVSLRPSEQDTFVLPEVAAEATEARRSASILRRLPLDFQPLRDLPAPLPLSRGTLTNSAIPTFQRPEGSFEARAFGNAVHAFLEAAAHKLGAGMNPQALVNELTSWLPRINAVLRSSGLAPQLVERYVQRVKSALLTALHDPSGLWILSAHHDAASEYALTSWDEVRSNVRLDRVFRAGPEPLAKGTEYRWIVDFKTSTYSGADIEAFLLREREKYAPQMAAYARILRDSADDFSIRLGLYYPMLPKLVWWTIDKD
jgi:ATP-dependent exoDNAse (exonuclease V) beta subunit